MCSTHQVWPRPFFHNSPHRGQNPPGLFCARSPPQAGLPGFRFPARRRIPAVSCGFGRPAPRGSRPRSRLSRLHNTGVSPLSQRERAGVRPSEPARCACLSCPAPASGCREKGTNQCRKGDSDERKHRASSLAQDRSKESAGGSEATEHAPNLAPRRQTQPRGLGVEPRSAQTAAQAEAIGPHGHTEGCAVRWLPWRARRRAVRRDPQAMKAIPAQAKRRSGSAVTRAWTPAMGKPDAEGDGDDDHDRVSEGEGFGGGISAAFLDRAAGSDGRRERPAGSGRRRR